jgi:hypothetical protein
MGRTQEDGRFWTECAQAFPEFLRLAVAKNFHTKCDFTSVKTVQNNLIHNTNKCTQIKTYTLTYNPSRLQHVSIFFRSSSWSLHHTSVYETQMNYHS